jgi:hypothetical protein
VGLGLEVEMVCDRELVLEEVPVVEVCPIVGILFPRVVPPHLNWGSGFCIVSVFCFCFVYCLFFVVYLCLLIVGEGSWCPASPCRHTAPELGLGVGG